MLQKLEIHGLHKNTDESLRKYAGKKIGKLDRFMSRHCRESAHGEVYLKEASKKDNNRCICEVTLRMPQHTIVVEERALNMYAAIDIAEEKLKTQLKKYKEQRGGGKLQRHLFAKFRRQTAA